MSNVIQFLESLGANAALANQSSAQYLAQIESLEFEDAERTALIDRDAYRLADALGGDRKLYCFVVPAESDEPTPDDGKKDDAPDEEETSETSAH